MTGMNDACGVQFDGAVYIYSIASVRSSHGSYNRDLLVALRESRARRVGAAETNLSRRRRRG